MSRTDKDRPWRIRSADPSEQQREESHNHRNLGAPIYRTFAVKDAKGDFIYREEHRDGIHFDREVGGWVNSPYTVRFRVYDKRLIGHVPDHCTIEENDNLNLPQHDYWAFTPCHYTLSNRKWNRPNAQEKHAWHSVHRTRERESLNTLTKGYNSGEDVEEWDEDESLSSRVRRHKGYWD